jgi:flagellar hook-associated protein 3 FlgL
MRISTSQIYNLGVATIQQRQQDQVKLQQQIASNLRVVTPSDDPIAASRALDIKQSQAVNDQYSANGDSAKSALGLEESALADMTNLLQDVKTLAVNAGNATLNNADRASIATELEGQYQQLLGIANRDDGNGQYLFSGYKGATQPFAETGAGNVTYAGDAGQRLAQIGPSRAIPINDSGQTVFQAIRNGNGTFATAPGAANSGGGVISAGTVSDPSKWNAAANARDFTIKFDVSAATPPVTTYDIVDNVNNVSLLTGAAPAAGPYLRTYVPGNAISLSTQAPPDTNPAPFDYGAALAIDGAPAGGDTFSVKASANQDIFATLQGLITTLRTGTNATPASVASYQNSLNSAMSGLDNTLDKVLTVRAGVGTRLREIDTAQSSSADTSLQYAKSLSGLQDLDYAKAISDLNQQQFYLQAAQQSFIKVTSLNLFSLLP